MCIKLVGGPYDGETCDVLIANSHVYRLSEDRQSWVYVGVFQHPDNRPPIHTDDIKSAELLRALQES